MRLFVACLALATIVSSGLVLLALNASPSPPIGWVPTLAAGQDRRAEALLRSDAFDEARSASEAALREAPYDTSALLRIAYIDVKEDGALDAQGIEALSESYRRAPLDRSVSLWRIRFSLEAWDRLPPGLRHSVQTEVFGVATEAGHVWPLRTRLSRVQNPRGRVVASLWRDRLERRIDPLSR